jgi:hypothetical protein
VGLRKDIVGIKVPILSIEQLFTIGRILDWVSTFSNLLVVTPGQHNFGMLNYPWVTWQHWLQDAVNVFKHPTIQHYINTFDPVRSKSQLFDVLLLVKH